MGLLQKSCILLGCLILCMVDSRGIAGNVKLVAMNGNQYWFSSSSPYAPNLNFHLAYQYCRTLGLQLVVLETKEEVETISAYLNSGDGNYLNVNKYWTSGNKLGADSWIWMSSGEQMNSSFSDYWLKSGTGSSSDNPKQCMSMKAPISKRAIFSSEECNKSLPFICEQVRCLYYNYPVSLFPDPADLRADLEDGPGTFSTPTESESRASPNVYSGDSIRSKNYISGRTINSPVLADIAAQESSRIDPSKIQRRITLRPVMTTYPYPPSYVNSFYKYKSVDYALTSTSRPSFKKTTRESLWSPGPEVSNSNTFSTVNLSPTSPTFAALTSSSESVSGTINKIGSSTKFSESTTNGGTTDKTVYITGKLLNPPNSTVSTSVETSVRSETNAPFTHTHLEIVTSRSASIDGEVVTDLNEESPTTSTYVSYGGPTEDFGMSTNPTIVFDDEQNNVGGEVDDGRASQTGQEVGKMSQLFYQGNGIRRPDTKSLGVTSRYQSSEETSTTFINPTPDREAEASQTHSLATMKMYQFQRGKLPINWSKGGSSSVSIIASTNTGPSKIGLGPRLKFRNRN